MKYPHLVKFKEFLQNELSPAIQELDKFQNDDNIFDAQRLRWEFFKLHANQRLTFFRYYIALLVASFVAYFYIYDHLRNCHGTIFLYICLILSGLIISCITVLFCYIDKRNRELIENAKKSLDEIKKLSNNNPEIAIKHNKIFSFAFFVTFTIGIILSIAAGFKLGLDYGSRGISPPEVCPTNSNEDDTPDKESSLTSKSEQSNKKPLVESSKNTRSSQSRLMYTPPKFHKE